MQLSCAVLFLVDDSLFKKEAHSRYDSTHFAQNERTRSEGV